MNPDKSRLVEVEVEGGKIGIVVLPPNGDDADHHQHIARTYEAKGWQCVFGVPERDLIGRDLPDVDYMRVMVFFKRSP